MDSLTHIALGACIGEALLGRRIGRAAMLWGAAAQSLPDIDFVAGFWMDLPHELLAHRGFTHSFLFLLLSPAMPKHSRQAWIACPAKYRTTTPCKKEPSPLP